MKTSLRKIKYVPFEEDWLYFGMIPPSVVCFLLFMGLAHTYETDGWEKIKCRIIDNAIPDRSCQYLIGNYTFKGNECPIGKYQEVEELDGALTFIDMEDHPDPMACFPELKRIYVQPDYRPPTPITIHKSVFNMKRFTFHPDLVIYSQTTPWIDIQANLYIMDAKTYRSVASRFGLANINIGNFSRDGECFLNDLILYMNELDECDIGRGSITINHKILTTRTTTKMHRLEGCIRINGTDSLELRHLGFLRRIKHVTCDDYPVILRNKKLCVTDAFLDEIADNHHKVNEIDKDGKKRKEWKEKTKRYNGYKGVCDTLCFADDLFKEHKNCTRIVGDLSLRNEHLPKLQYLTMIRGRLIIDGLGQEDIFSHLPSLQLIKPYDHKEPALLIRRNRILRYVNIPDDLEIDSPAKPLIVVTNNFFYKMQKEELDVLLKKYRREQLDIDWLQPKQCYFPARIQHISELDGCEVVYGDLELFGDVGLHNETNATLRIVTGCIRINGTQMKELSFMLHLDGRSGIDCTDGHSLTHNTYLCAHLWHHIFARTRAGNGTLRATFAYNRQYCEKECSRDMLFFSQDCLMVTEGFSLPLVAMDTFIPAIMNMKEANGPIRIKHSNLTEINMFTSLEYITVKGDEPAIQIEHNKKLKSIDFRTLKNIKSLNSTSKLIVIKNNGKYRMPLQQYNQIVEKYGEENVDIDYVETKHSRDVGIYLGIGCAVVVGLLMCVGVFAWRLHVLRRKKFGKDEEEKEKLLKNGNDKKKKGKKDNKNESLPTPEDGKESKTDTVDHVTPGGPLDDNEQANPAGDETLNPSTMKVSVAGAVTARTIAPSKMGATGKNEYKTTNEVIVGNKPSKMAVTAKTAQMDDNYVKISNMEMKMAEVSKIKPTTKRTTSVTTDGGKSIGIVKSNESMDQRLKSSDDVSLDKSILPTKK